MGKVNSKPITFWADESFQKMIDKEMHKRKLRNKSEFLRTVIEKGVRKI